MRVPRERILLFRSGRHLRAAIDALRTDSPECDITIVSTPAALPLLDQIGVDAEHRIVYERTPFFRPWAFITSSAGLRALTGGFTRVCVLWNDPDGSGQANVDHTALLVSPRGFTAITADGAIVNHRTGPLAWRELTRAVKSIGVAAALWLFVFLPARFLRPLRS